MTLNTLAWLTKLVGYDTTSHHSNLDLIHAVADWLNDFGITSTIIKNASGEKANLFAIISNKNNSHLNGLILSAHTDVVPVTNQNWKTPPFTATVIDNNVYGRGTCDMKGFIAVILSLIPQFVNTNLNFPLYLALSYDEEVGCHGVPFLIKHLEQQHIKPIGCIVGEPTEMQPVISHKGIHHYHCRFYGKAAHSSLTPKACNAIEYAAQLIHWIKCFSKEIKTSELQDTHFDVPFTTMTTNVINGGIAANIIPSFCEFHFEFRHLPTTDPQQIIDQIKKHIDTQILPAMQEEYPEATIEIIKISSVPSFNSSQNSFLKKIIGISQKKVSYATEAGLFEQAGIPSIVCGPGNIEQAHKPNEFISLDQLTKCELFLKNLILS